MSGRISVAPCGHTGEVIIGTYIKCLLGCEGKAAMSARGEPGHVPNCTCKPCQIRRRTVAILLRSHDGKDIARMPWNGSDNKLRVLCEVAGSICAYKFLDMDNKVVAAGNIDDVYVVAGAHLNVDITTFVNHAAKNSVGFVSWTSITVDKPTTKTYDPGSIVMTFNGQVLTPASGGFVSNNRPPVTIPTKLPATVSGGCSGTIIGNSTDPVQQAWNDIMDAAKPLPMKVLTPTDVMDLMNYIGNQIKP